MGKYRLYDTPDSTAASPTNTVMPAGAASVGVSAVLSNHCAAGEHDYGYSDICGCPCHKGMRPSW